MPSANRPSLLATVILLALPGVLPAQTGAQVCVGADKVLRYFAGACPAGQTALTLPASPPGQASGPDQSRTIADLQAKVAELRGQVAELEKDAQGPGPTRQVPRPAAGTRLTAPFEVVDENGKPIFAVVAKRRGFEVRGASGKVLIQGFAEENIAAIKVFDPASPTSYAAIGSMNNAPVLQTTWNGKARTSVGVKGEGAASLDFFGDNGKQIVELTKGASGGGRLSIFDAEGTAQVQAGIATQGPAVVRVGKSPSCLPKAGLVVPDCIKSADQGQ